MAVIDTLQQNKKTITDWFLRLVKGVIIGIGAIVPGLSGGVFAVIFGFYNPLIHFLGNIKYNFWKNAIFFFPVVFGILLGGMLFSAVVDAVFVRYAAEFTWLFVGFITGTLPSIHHTAGKMGRKPIHWVSLILTAALIFLFMLWLSDTSTVSVKPSFINWVMSGVLVGLGVVLPGMSPSNFLIYLELYQPMAHGISRLDPAVLVPLTIGLIVVILVFARLVSYLFKHSYALMYHLILGVVIGSTLAILPLGIRGWQIPISVLLFGVGLIGSILLSKLDEKYPHEPIY